MDNIIEVFQDKEVYEMIRTALSVIRNQNFHYTGKIKPDTLDEEKRVIAETLFEKEFEELGNKYIQKYYSNSVPRFYKEQDIRGLMDRLYNGEKERPAQVPAFQHIVNRTTQDYVMLALIKGKPMSRIERESQRNEFKRALFFLWKEIYYYGFLQEKNIKERVFHQLELQENGKPADGMRDGRQQKTDEKAVKDFKRRWEEIEEKGIVSFGEICQQFLTDYHMQNSDKIVRKSSAQQDKIYKHFRSLLYCCIKEAFITYLKEKPFDFLRSPVICEEENIPALEAYCFGWKAHTFDGLKTSMEKENGLLCWYIFGHFLSPRQLNHLIGSIKSYIQFQGDVNRRADGTGNRVQHIEEHVSVYKDILSVLQFNVAFCGQVSNVITDYFEDEEAYAQYLSYYLDFGNKGNTSVKSLKAFCMSSVRKGSPNGRIGIYCDDQNLIVNRNIILSFLYGNERLLSECMDRITDKEILDYYRLADKLKDVFKYGGYKCREKSGRKLKEELKGAYEEQRAFQNKKNRIELLDVLTYSEIINDLYAQLISWTYLRERDLMYFQLGIHYLRMFYGRKWEEKSWMRKLKGDDICLEDGAILYQIIAMYTYKLKDYHVKDGKAVCDGKFQSTGASIKNFTDSYCDGDKSIYMQGLCLFEITNEHDGITQFRNYIDHFKYFAYLDRSILELYAEVYDRFFTYDLKLQKSVTYVFKNILMKYFVKTKIELGGKTERMDDKEEKMRTATVLSIPEGGLISDKFMYKTTNLFDDKRPSNRSELVDKKMSVAIDARSEDFCRQLRNILQYVKK